MIHCKKDIFFCVRLFFLLTFTGTTSKSVTSATSGRNGAVSVELYGLCVLNGTFVTFSGGSHH